MERKDIFFSELRERKFDSVLSKIIKSEPGIRKIILVDRTGLTIAHVSKFSYVSVDVDGIGAIASAVFMASAEQGSNLTIGGLDIVTSEFDTGKIFASSCGRGILTIISDAEVNIGMIRLLMRKANEELSTILDDFLTGQPSRALPGMPSATPEVRTGLEKDELEAALAELEKF
ncbi:MAG: roadblock/LC7 domain-containing protein [Candidatus Hodarchaeales archaeon]